MFGDLKIGQQLYRCLCQNADCRSTLGAIHIPCVGGRVVFVCHGCGTVSEFRNTADGFEVKALGEVKVNGAGAGNGAARRANGRVA